MAQTPAEAAWAKLAELQAASDKLFNPAIPQAEWQKAPQDRVEFRRLVEAVVALCRSQGIWEHVKAEIEAGNHAQTTKE